jgi:hypothetical protein
MSQEEPMWYLPGENQQPTGPFSTDDVLARCRAGDLKGETFCWCNGMDGWKPMAEIEPFSGIFAPAAGEGAAEGIEDLGKAFGRAIDFTKRKAKTASLRVSIGKHEKHRQQLLSELGAMLYLREADIALFSEEPYAGKLGQVKQVDQLIKSLRDQMADIGKTGGPTS